MSEIRVGILGAPSVGKSDLASAIVEKWTEDLGDKPVLIETTGKDIEGNLIEGFDTADGLILGEKGTWRTSLILYARLLVARQKAPMETLPTVEVGTCFDRMAHCGHRLVQLSEQILDPLFTDTMREELIHLQQALPCLAIALVETWNYDYAFYIPVEDGASDFEKGVDSALQELMNSYLAAGTPLNILKLEGGTSSDRADTVIRVMREFEPSRREKLREIMEAELALRNGDQNGTDEPDSQVAEGTP